MTCLVISVLKWLFFNLSVYSFFVINNSNILYTSCILSVPFILVLLRHTLFVNIVYCIVIINKPHYTKKSVNAHYIKNKIIEGLRAEVCAVARSEPVKFAVALRPVTRGQGVENTRGAFDWEIGFRF